MKKNHLILVCIFAVIIAVMPQRVQAQIDPGDTNLNGSLVTLNTITTAVPFMMIAPDSRSGALGDCGVALSADANSLHWNAAKMVFSENEQEMSLSYAPWLRTLVSDMNLSYLSTVKKLNRRQAYGLALRYFDLGNITFTDNSEPKSANSSQLS